MELLVIGVVALLVFGPKKLPELGKSLGKGLAEFRRASSELRGSLEREMENIEHEVKAQEVKAQAAIPPAETGPASSDLPPTHEDTPATPVAVPESSRETQHDQHEIHS